MRTLTKHKKFAKIALLSNKIKMSEAAQNDREWRDIPPLPDPPGQNSGERVWRDVSPTDTSPMFSGSEAEKAKAAEAILAGHMHEYDATVHNAHSFVRDVLKMQDVCSPSKVAVLPEDPATGRTQGHYFPELDVARVYKHSSGRPKSDELALVVSIVHELAHSATATPENVETVHSFYHEAVAGIAEYFALQDLASTNKYTQPSDKSYTREIDGEDVTIIIPGKYHRADVLELADEKSESTQALVAATVAGIGLANIRLPARDVLAMARHDDPAAFDALKEAVASISPDLVRYIESQPNGSTDAVIRIAHKAQQAVRLVP